MQGETIPGIIAYCMGRMQRMIAAFHQPPTKGGFVVGANTGDPHDTPESVIPLNDEAMARIAEAIQKNGPVNLSIDGKRLAEAIEKTKKDEPDIR